MKLYTRVVVNITKLIKKHPFLGTCFSLNIWIKQDKIIPLHPDPFQKCSGYFFSCVDYCMSNAHHSSVSFCFFFNPKTIIFVDLSYYLYIGIHPSNTGEKLVYYHLSHEEASFYLDACIQLFSRIFIIFEFNTTIPYNDKTHLVFSLYTEFY